MRSFTVIAALACLAVVVLHIAQADAQRGGGNKKCKEPKPALEPADTVECDRRQRPPGQFRKCVRNCRNCYERNELARLPGCLRDRECVCLGKTDGSTTTPVVPPTSEEPTTTEGSGSSVPTTTEGAGETSTAGPVIPSSEQPGEPTTEVVTEAPAQP